MIADALSQPLDNEDLLYQLVLFIRTVTSGGDDVKNMELVMKLEFGPKIVAMLDCESERVQAEAAWTIINIAGSGSDYCVQLIELGAHKLLAKILAGTAGSHLKEQVSYDCIVQI